jgi:hypothetical protein
MVGTINTYAYAFEWNAYYAPRALYRLQKAGVKAKVATKPFEAATADLPAEGRLSPQAGGKKSFDYGTILIPLGIQQEKADTVRKLLDVIAREDAVRVYALATGLSAGGIDLGSPSFAALEMPRAALVTGPGVSFTDAGEVWHLLDARFNMSVGLLETTALGRVDLSKYNVLALASGNYGSIDSAGRENLRRWVESGGTLIAMENATEWAVNNKLATAKFRRDEPRKDSVLARRPYVDEEPYTRALTIPGTIFEAKLDRTHPLAFGYESETMIVFRGTTVFMDPSKNPYASPLVYTANPLVSGYVHKDQLKHAKNSAAIVVSALRSGRVILMADNPNFRAFWYGTNKLFLNAVFFGSTIRTSSARAGE